MQFIANIGNFYDMNWLVLGWPQAEPFRQNGRKMHEDYFRLAPLHQWENKAQCTSLSNWCSQLIDKVDVRKFFFTDQLMHVVHTMNITVNTSPENVKCLNRVTFLVTFGEMQCVKGFVVSNCLFRSFWWLCSSLARLICPVYSLRLQHTCSHQTHTDTVARQLPHHMDAFHLAMLNTATANLLHLLHLTVFAVYLGIRAL